MTHINIQPATLAQKSAVIPLLRTAGEGIFEFLIDDILPFITTKMVLSTLYEKTDQMYSYKNVHVAVDDHDKVVGAILMYPSAQHDLSGLLNQRIPQDRLDHLAPLSNAPLPESQYISLLAVNEKQRNQGIGSQLLALAETTAKATGTTQVSLRVWKDNTNAIGFYQHHGFTVSQSIDIASHRRLPHTGGMALMVKTIV